MHILFFISDLVGGGAERVTAILANYWVQRGDTVTVVTYEGPLLGEFELAPSVHRVALGFPAASGNVVDAIAKNARRVFSLRRILGERRPDIAIAIQNLPSCMLALAGRPHGGVSIGTERIYPPSLPIGRFADLVRKFSYGWLDAVVAQTEESASWLKDNTGARHAPVIFNPVSIPAPAASPAVSPAKFLDPAHKTLFAAGRLVPQKGFDRLLRAFASVAPAHPDWRLAIAGEGGLEGELEALARTLKIAERLVMPGRVGNMGDWYEAADGFALTSLFEGFPNVLCEAMGYGLPVVSVDCLTGPRSLIEDGVNGLLVPQDNPDALAAALGRIMSDAALRQRLGANAGKVRERLSLPAITGEWEKLFDGLLARRKG